MLQTIRDNLQGTLAKVIIAIIIVPFAIFGVESLISIGGTDAAAEINGEEISPVELERALRIQQRRLLAAMGENAQPAALDESRLRGPVLDMLIERELVLQYAAELGLGVPDQLVDQIIVATPEFQDNGRFSADRYRAVLANQGYSPSYFKHEVVRKEMLVGQLQRGLMLSDFATPAELGAIAAFVGQQRSFSWLLVPASLGETESAVGETDIQQYYEQNSARFMQPAQVKLAYVDLRTENFEPSVSEADVRAEYEREIAAPGQQDLHEVAHILVEKNGDRNGASARQLAQDLYEKLEAGADFSKLAADSSDDLGSRGDGGRLGTTSGSTFPPAFEAAVAELAVGQVSEPIETEAGWHLIKLLSEQRAAAPAYEERHEAIAARLAADRARPELLQAVERLRDLAFNAENLAGPASKLDLEVKESDWLAADNEHPLLGEPKVMAAAFSDEVLAQGHNSDVIELSPDQFVAVRVLDQRPEQPLPLEEVRDEIATTLTRERALAVARETARQLAARVREGVPLAELAEQQGYRHGNLESVARDAQAPVDGLVAAAFAMPKPDKNTGMTVDLKELPEEPAVAVLALTDVEPGYIDALAEAERAAWRQEIARSEGQTSLRALLERLKDTAEIERF